MHAFFAIIENSEVIFFKCFCNKFHLLFEQTIKKSTVRRLTRNIGVLI